MSDESTLFPLKNQGVGYRVKHSDGVSVDPEGLYEDVYTHIKDRPMYVGRLIPQWKYFAAYGLVVLLGLVLVGRAFWMQVPQNGVFTTKAENNRLRITPLPATRGVIRDRNGIILAENTPSFDVDVVPWLLPPDPNAQLELLGSIARAAGVPVDQLQSALASSTDQYQPVPLVRDLSYDRALAVDISVTDPSVELVVGSKRYYPQSAVTTSLSDVLGYVGVISTKGLSENPGYLPSDQIGKAGIESSYESELRGTPGEQVYEVDARGEPTSLVSTTPPKAGTDITLTLDAHLQAVAESALEEELQTIHLTRGSVVALDPRDGSVLALVSLPAYDDNDFSGTVSSTVYAKLVNDPDHPLLPRAWAGVYPSGSTIKSVVATAALAEGVITPDTTVDSVGGFTVGGHFFPDWKAGGHGITNVTKALAWSVNTFFYTVGGGYQSFVGLGVDKLTAWMRKFGLGTPTGIDLPGEAAGFVPSKEWKQQTKGEPWYIGDTYNLSIGQGDLLITPLQDAVFTGEVANGGYKITPHLVASSTLASAPKIQLAPPEDIKVVQEGLRDTVTYGSGHALASLSFPVSGKTGTAQWRADKPNHAWFACYAPSDDPQIVVTVMIEEGIGGDVTAVPVAKKVLQAWWDEQHTSSTPAMPAASSTIGLK